MPARSVVGPAGSGLEMEEAIVPTGARGCDWDPPGIMQLPLPLLSPAALCISFHQNLLVGCGDHTFRG